MPPNIPQTFALIDAAHSLDPNSYTLADGTFVPYELHYAHRCSYYLSLHICPDPSSDTTTATETKFDSSTTHPLLATACRAQHFRRWEIPRSSYPAGKPGYLSWRTFLKRRQAEQIHDLCLLPECNFTPEEAARVAALVRKEGLLKGEGKGDAEVQILEDVACLVFLEMELEGFEKGLGDEEKMVGILRKTWAKMGERGRELALKVEMGNRGRELVGKALAKA
jgi:Domain of unknown function (DUF4202)